MLPRALGGYVLGLINRFSLAAAAVECDFAYNQGSKEQDAFVKSIVTTGNISGDRWMLGGAPALISSVAGTQSKAAEHRRVRCRGVRGGTMLEKYAQTAIQWERPGQSVAKTAEQFRQPRKTRVIRAPKLNGNIRGTGHQRLTETQSRSTNTDQQARQKVGRAQHDQIKARLSKTRLHRGPRESRHQLQKADAMLMLGAPKLAQANSPACARRSISACSAAPSTTCWQCGHWEKGNENKLTAGRARAHAAPWCQAEAERNKQLARVNWQSGEQYLSKRARMERRDCQNHNEAAAAGVGAG